MAGNPTNWWSMNLHDSHEQLSSTSSQHFYGSSNFLADNIIPTQDFPRSWSQLLLAGLSSDQEKSGLTNFHQYKKLENWEDQSLNSNDIQYPSCNFRVPIVDVKSEVGQLFNYHHYQDNLPAASSPASSCVTTNLNHNILNFSSGNKTAKVATKHQNPDHSSECNSTSSKKAKVQHSSAQPSLKVRKEKLGDRITALHQLVSPFGKTDTASVLSEAIGYIRFLQGQIEALSSPYMGNVGAGSMGHTHQQPDCQHRVKDLRSRGLCLVPISCTQHFGGDTTGVGDYWAPTTFGGSSPYL